MNHRPLAGPFSLIVVPDAVLVSNRAVIF